MSAIAFLLGVTTLNFFHHLPSIGWLAIALAFVLFISWCSWRLSGYISFLLLIAWLGFLWAWCCAYWQLQHILPKNLEDKTIVAQGYIASIPEQLPRGARFEFEIKQLQYQDKQWPTPSRARLTWENPPPKLTPGEQWQLQVRLKQPHSTLNPGSFDYEGWLFEHDIRALGYVINANNHLVQAAPWYRDPIDRYRQDLALAIQHSLNNNPLVGFITALTVGVRDNIAAPQWQTLRATGTNHLFAIAGLHIGFVAGIAFWIISFGWRRLGNLSLYFPTPQAAALVSLLTAIFYSAMAGFSLPTTRAVIMIGVFLLAILWRRHLAPTRALLLALWIILILNPLTPLTSSFWLSFAAVALLIYGMSGRLNKKKTWWRHWLHAQWLIAVGLIPLLLLFFQQVALAGLVANIIAIPYVGLIVLPLSLLASLLWVIVPYWGYELWLLAAHLLAGCWLILQKIATINWLQWHTAISNNKLMLAASIGVLLLLAPRGFPLRWFGIIGLLPLGWWQAPAPAAGEVWFTLLDVGQGLSAVVRTQHHVLIYDTGAKFYDGFDMGDAVVVPYLRVNNIRQVDMLVISHGDNDHMGGAQSVLAETHVKSIMTSVPERFAPGLAKSCQQGQSWQWDNVTFTFIYPPIGQPNLDNDSSCVLRITTGKNSILLPGDIEHKSENYLVKNEAEFLPATILVAPHHGSITSSTPAFVAAVQPHYVFYPIGYLNRYGFPAPAIIARYQQANAIQYDTVTAGTISVKINGQEIIMPPQSYRQNYGRYWNNE